MLLVHVQLLLGMLAFEPNANLILESVRALTWKMNTDKLKNAMVKQESSSPIIEM